MTDNNTHMDKFVWNRESANAIASFMEDIEAAQITLDEGNTEESKRMVQQASTRLTESLKGQLYHVGIGYGVAVGLIHCFIELKDFSENEVELTIKARRLVR